MRVMPLAADSLGVRSMATYVEAGALRLLLDPGATLSPRRYNLGPAPEEEEALKRALDRIEGYARRATLITVSHYHGDHYRPEPEIYAGRRVWAKDPRRTTVAHQAARAGAFWRDLEAHCILEPAEGRVAEFGGVRVKVSPPLPHGREGSGFGFVVVVTVDDGMRFVHAADVQGPISAVATAYLLRERPDLLYLSGPPTYLEAQAGPDAVRAGLENLLRIVNETGCRVIVDHHAVRERRYRERLGPAFETGRVVTAAEYLGRREECLEAYRPALWARYRRSGSGPVRCS
ncbi:MAG: MBL fold metallo-hydrolase [Candidatus Rokubacteria bacterium]|nr:MBL fold metallo-hydrolase [Candidatus Rokubacteria bacterium]